MDAAGIDKAAIVHSSTTYGYDNSYVADAVASHRGRFTGVFSVDVCAADAPARIRYWLRRGPSGLRLFAARRTLAPGQDLNAHPAPYPPPQCFPAPNIPVTLPMPPESPP